MLLNLVTYINILTCCLIKRYTLLTAGNVAGGWLNVGNSPAVGRRGPAGQAVGTEAPGPGPPHP